MQHSLKSQRFCVGLQLHWSSIHNVTQPAPCSSVLREASLPGRLVCGLEFGRHVISGAKVDLIGRLAEECRMGHHRVVLIDVKGSQSLQTDEVDSPY
jgi:hypothetical protein